MTVDSGSDAVAVLFWQDLLSFGRIQFVAIPILVPYVKSGWRYKCKQP